MNFGIRGHKFGTILAFIILAVICVSPACAHAWTHETVASVGDVGKFSSIALDSFGKPCISYIDNTNNNLMYAAWNGASWDIEIVDSAHLDLMSSLALDSANIPHISYDDKTTGNLKHAYKFGGSWVIETVDDSINGVYQSSLKIISGNPRISYSGCNTTPTIQCQLKYAEWLGIGGGWHIQTVDNILTQRNSLALDSTGNPRISYYDNNNHTLMYAARNLSGSWAKQTVDNVGDVGYGNSIAIGTDGYPIISYCDISNTSLKYAKWDGATWIKETVDSDAVVTDTSLKLSSSNSPSISYIGWSSKGQIEKYAALNSESETPSWTIETMSQPGAGYSSLELDSNGRPHISYYGSMNGNLMYTVGWPYPGSKVGVFRNGFWILDMNGNLQWDGTDSGQDVVAGFGQAGDRPVTGRWDYHLGPDCIGVFRNGTWLLDYNGNYQWDGVDKTASLGTTGDIPVTGDWNTTMEKRIGVFRNGFWIIDRNGNFLWDGTGPGGDLVTGFGTTGDIPVVGDWNGNHKEKIGVFRNGFWILDNNGNFQWDGTGTGGDLVAGFGAAGDVPVVRDYNGDYLPEIGVFRPSTGQWIIDKNRNYQWDGTGFGQDVTASLGQNGDVGVAAELNGNANHEIGVFRNGFWILDYNGNYLWDGPGDDKVAGFGTTGDIPVMGNLQLITL
jgi:hypothetical protein